MEWNDFGSSTTWVPVCRDFRLRTSNEKGRQLRRPYPIRRAAAFASACHSIASSDHSFRADVSETSLPRNSHIRARARCRLVRKSEPSDIALLHIGRERGSVSQSPIMPVGRARIIRPCASLQIEASPICSKFWNQDNCLINLGLRVKYEQHHYLRPSRSLTHCGVGPGRPSSHVERHFTIGGRN